MDVEKLEFEHFKVKLQKPNELESSKTVQSDLLGYLTLFSTQLTSFKQEISTVKKDELSYLLDQLDGLMDYFLTMYDGVTEIHCLSLEIDSLVAKNYTDLLSLMLTTAHGKFNIKLIDFVNKLNRLVCDNIKKLSLSKNWYSSIKHMAIIILQFIFNKFNGFLNSTKGTLLTCLYKHLMKVHDNYNSSIENSIFRANYFTDLLKLTDLIVNNDNNSHALDNKLFNRLLKLSKVITSSKTKTEYTYPIMSILHGNNLLVALLKSDRYLSSITTKKSVNNPSQYLTSIQNYTYGNFITAFNTDSKKLRLHLSKNLSDLLVFNFIVYGVNQGDSDKLLNLTLNFILINYSSESNIKIKSGLLETLVQFLSSMDLYYQTNKVSTGFKNGITFTSLQIFKILNILFFRVFGVQSMEIDSETDMSKAILTKDHNLKVIDNSSNFNDAITVLNELEVLYGFLIREIGTDINKLIMLGKLTLNSSTSSNQYTHFRSLHEMIPNESTKSVNQWHTLSTLKFIQLLIVDLDQYVLSHQSAVSNKSFTNEDIATQISRVLFTLSKHQNFQVRVLATETLVKILNIKPELCFDILNDSLNTLLHNLDETDNIESSAFNVNHGLSFLISSILTNCPKNYISTDFTLKVFSMTNHLKKFNSTVIQTNLFGTSSNSNSIISNINYEKQLISWIMLMGLFNFATPVDETGNEEVKNNNDFFLSGNTQFINIWKGLLAHSVPSNFVQIEKVKTPNSSKTSTKIENLNELMKLIEIKNHSLVCLLSYITYLSSTKVASVVQTHDLSSNNYTSLLTPEISRQLNQILNKSFAFINSIKSQILSSGGTIPVVLENNINFNKLRIYQAFIKLMPYLNIKNDINSAMLIEIVNNFSDFSIYNYSFKKEDEAVNSSVKSKKPSNETLLIDEKEIFTLNDGLTYGLTSKITHYKVDELLIKSTGLKSTNTKASNSNDIDQLHNTHASISIESPFVKSSLLPVGVFDDNFESMIYQPLQHSFFNDYLIVLYNGGGGKNIGYTNFYQYSVNRDTMIIDISIELFAIAFPHLTLKVQQSIVETIRSSILIKVAEIKEVESAETTNGGLKKYKGDMMRKRALLINCSIAFHSLLNYMNNSGSKQHPLVLPKVIGSWILETIKSLNSNINNSFLTSLNAESIGLCTSLIEDELKEEAVSQNLSLTIKSIIDDTNPYTRSFAVQSLSHIQCSPSLTNSYDILNVILSLIADPHPVVHLAALDSLTTLLLRKSQMELSESLLSKIIQTLEYIWCSDEYGSRSPVTVASNMNCEIEGNSTVGIARLFRVLMNNLGPIILTMDEDLKQRLKNLLFVILNTTITDYEVISRELIKSLDEIVLFDRSFISLADHTNFLKFTLLNNFKVGIYGGCITELPFQKEDNDTMFELFPITSSRRNLNHAIDSYLQLVKLNSTDLITQDVEKLIWIALDAASPNSKSAEKILDYLLENSITSSSTSIEEKLMWFDKLFGLFSIPKNSLCKELLDVFKYRIDNGGMFFGKGVQLSSVATKSSYTANVTTAPQQNQGGSLSSDEEGEGFNAHSGEADDDDRTDDHSSVFNRPSANVNAATDTKVALPRSNTTNNNADFPSASGSSTDNDFVKLMVLENEPVTWKFKVFVLELILKYLNYSRSNVKLHSYLVTKVPEIIRLTLVCSTSNIVALRMKSIDLLDIILDVFGDTRDSLYPDAYLLEQQQAQIITAIIPAFNKESNLELAGKAILLSSKLISSHITQISRMSRITKILSVSLEDFASIKLDQHNSNGGVASDEISGVASSTALKIGEIQVLTPKSQSKIQLSILHAWARLLINEVDPDGELHQLILKYIDILIPLWLYSLREFSMIKYGGSFISSNGDELDIQSYEDSWLDILNAVTVVIEQDFSRCQSLLTQDSGSFFFVLFGQCMEALIKVSSKSGSSDHKAEKTIFRVLKRILSLDDTSSMIFKDSVFIEFIDLLDRLVLISDISIKTNIVELSSVVFKNYFESSTSNKSEEELHGDVDKLFELLRVNMLAVNQILPFIRDGEINIDKLKLIHGPELLVLKKCYDSMFEMISYLPDVIKNDFCACCLYQFTLIYQLKNSDVISVLLPTLKKILTYLVSAGTKNFTLINDFYNTIRPFLQNDKEHKDSLLTTYVIITTCDDSLVLSEDEAEVNADSIISGLISKDNLMTIATQTIKALMQSVNKEGSPAMIMLKLLPKLTKLLTNSIHRINGEEIKDPTYYLDEPRLILETFVLFTKSLSGDEDEKILQSLNITIPILIWFDSVMYKLNSNDLRAREYVHNKLVELITFKPEIFKTLIGSVSSAQKANIESLVKFDIHVALANNNKETEASGEGHIQLKTFG